ncbi:hypothetical protein AX14_008652, partial [Amanita brunnescens Koide BX004]
ACIAGSRIFVQSGIYDKFLAKLTESAKAIKLGDPFVIDTTQGPLVSQTQFDVRLFRFGIKRPLTKYLQRVMGYIKSGKEDGATVHCGGEQEGSKGFYVKPTLFTDVGADMKIMREEIFGPVGAVVKFEDEEDIIKKANDTIYGLAAYVFSQNLTRAIESAHKLKAGSVWVNCGILVSPSVPFGGYKQSGFGRENGQYALDDYTVVKAVHINLKHRL